MIAIMSALREPSAIVLLSSAFALMPVKAFGYVDSNGLALLKLYLTLIWQLYPNNGL
ncbi:hypothetical protein PA25_09680 [Pseudoalteromonas sp. A25]|nr:hypothetical protein PA25_09680 [Pseudoalteromonas sp. A25]